MLKKYFILNLYFLMLFIEIRETQRAYVLEVRVHQYTKCLNELSSHKSVHRSAILNTMSTENWSCFIVDSAGNILS